MYNHSAYSLLSPSYVRDILTDVDQDKAKSLVPWTVYPVEDLEAVSMYGWVVTVFVDQNSQKTLKPKLVCAKGDFQETSHLL